MFNRKSDGSPFEPGEIEAVWQKGTVVAGNDPKVFRKDRCGHFINRNAYGDINHAYGWEIDHEKPKAKGGQTVLSNLEPLFWKNNRSKGDNYPTWQCAYHS